MKNKNVTRNPEDARYKIQWHLFSWTAFRLNLVWWTWKPLIRVEWEEPTCGMIGNQLRHVEASWSIEWLSIYFKVIVWRENERN